MTTSESADDRVAMRLDEVDALVRRALTRHGADEPNAAAVARTITAAERDVCESHGLFRLPGYVASLKSGKVRGDARPCLSRPAPAVIGVDAGGGFAPLALAEGHEPLVALARETGIAALAIRDVYHFAALWPEVEAIAEAGLVGFACTAATPMVAPAGGTRPFYGTNPIAFGCPRRAASPMVFDQASAAMARGDVMIHARDGQPVPEGVGIGPDGEPTTDPEAVLAGAQLAFGGYKGASIAMMVEILAGAVVGEAFSFQAGERGPRDGGPPVGGEFLLAIDPGRFGHGTDWIDRAETFFQALLAQPGTRLPGARRHEVRAHSLAHGVRIRRALHETCTALANA
ncbi:MAG: Ldh family oxidoreductase [Pseudomonadota bacterium]